jgi:hypothetical protein
MFEENLLKREEELMIGWVEGVTAFLRDFQILISKFTKDIHLVVLTRQNQSGILKHSMVLYSRSLPAKLSSLSTTTVLPCYINSIIFQQKFKLILPIVPTFANFLNSNKSSASAYGCQLKGTFERLSDKKFTKFHVAPRNSLFRKKVCKYL